MATILDMLQAEEPDYAAIALQVNEKDEQALRDALDSANNNVGLASKATYLLGHVSAPFGNVLLSQAVLSVRVEVRIASAGAMALVDKNFAVSQLKKLLLDQSHSVRKVSIQSAITQNALELKNQLDQIRQNDPFPYLRDLANHALILII